MSEAIIIRDAYTSTGFDLQNYPGNDVNFNSNKQNVQIPQIFSPTNLSSKKYRVDSNKQRKNIEVINSWRSLKKGWNCYDADPIDSMVIDRAIEFIKELKIQPEVFPTARNSIQFEYEFSEGTYLEIEIFEDSIDYYLEYANGDKSEEVENAAWTEVKHLIKKIHSALKS